MISAPSSKLTAPVLGMSLAAISTVLYLSPIGASLPTGKSVPLLPRTTSAASPAAAGSLISSGAAGASSTASKWATGSATTSRHSAVISRPRTTPTYSHSTYSGGHVYTNPSSGSTSKSSAGHTSKKKAASVACYDFKWQQDAQTVYVKNLSDPWGLDAEPGPDDGDGLACTGLPVDPSRAASIPIGAYAPPPASAGTKADLLAPSLDYYGVAQNGLPGDSAMFDQVATSTGKAPSAVEWFSGWDTDYDSAKVQEAWARDSLPVITWMTKSTTGGQDSDYSMTKILAGDLDDYIYKYATDIVRTNLPVVIRFDHEMNGNWYPWGAGLTDYHNSPANYIAMWRYVWNIFQKVHANQDVMWLWSPARVDNVDPSIHTGSTLTKISDDYPGDQYVDLVGASVYLRDARENPDYDTSFGNTVGQLEAVSSKPLFFAEVGSIETDPSGADQSSLKAHWIENTLSGILADPRIVGFVWFNNVATQAGDNGSITNDWRFNSSAKALKAFKRGVSDARFASGSMPDGS